MYYNELYHFGIPGMKWGVRRYQNEDRSLTAVGKKRYGTGNGKTSVGAKIGAGVSAVGAGVAGAAGAAARSFKNRAADAKFLADRADERMDKKIRKMIEYKSAIDSDTSYVQRLQSRLDRAKDALRSGQLKDHLGASNVSNIGKYQNRIRDVKSSIEKGQATLDKISAAYVKDHGEWSAGQKAYETLMRNNRTAMNIAVASLAVAGVAGAAAYGYHKYQQHKAKKNSDRS